MSGKRWYKSGLRFQCIGCGRCCRGAPGYVWCSLREAERIAAYLGLPLLDFIKRYLRSVDGDWSLRERYNGSCIFYDEETARCTIYEVRPAQCRTFPFWPSIIVSRKMWESYARECPGMNRGRLYTADEIEKIAFGQPMAYRL